jgi:cathepsin L
MQLTLLSLLVLALSYVAFSDVSEVEYLKAFAEFKANYGKVYMTAEEEEHRYKVFKANLKFVNEFDSEERGFEVKMNSFGDLSAEEFGLLYRGTKIEKEIPVVTANVEIDQPLAATVDWRTKGAVTKIKNQGQCGSCWSFSTTGSVEGAWFIAKHKLVSLSEQNLVDCSTAEGNQGCNGGLMDQAFQYIINNHGIDTEASYPYKAVDGRCHFTASNVGATISSFVDVASGSETALAAAVEKTPVSVAIDASQNSFQFYSSGVYYEPACSSSSLDHGVLAVGYGVEGGKDYWIVKNSWGTDWGMAGYINMSRNKNNNCGIATSASYPVV